MLQVESFFEKSTSVIVFVFGETKNTILSISYSELWFVDPK